jgi:hypothetical protein
MDHGTAQLVFLDAIERHLGELRKLEGNVARLLEETKKHLQRKRRFKMEVSRNRQTRLIEDVELIELDAEDSQPTALTPRKKK